MWEGQSESEVRMGAEGEKEMWWQKQGFGVFPVLEGPWAKEYGQPLEAKEQIPSWSVQKAHSSTVTLSLAL